MVNICYRIHSLGWTQLEITSKAWRQESRMLHLDLNWPNESWWKGVLPNLHEDLLISETCLPEESASHHGFRKNCIATLGLGWYGLRAESIQLGALPLAEEEGVWITLLPWKQIKSNRNTSEIHVPENETGHGRRFAKALGLTRDDLWHHGASRKSISESQLFSYYGVNISFWSGL